VEAVVNPLTPKNARFVTVAQPALRLFCTDSGKPNGPVLIFLHGFPFNHTQWNAQVALCEPHFRVITYDARGHGLSDVGTGQVIFEQWVDDLFILMDTLSIPKAVLCGLSMGGYVALRAADRGPERVQGLILCDTRSEADSDETRLKRAKDLATIRDQGAPVFIEGFLRAVLAPQSVQRHPEIVEAVRRMMSENPVLGLCGSLIALATRTDTTPALSKIRAPTLILVGEEDRITPSSVAAAMQKRIKSSQRAVIPKAGHLSNLENPASFNAALLPFLKKHFV
jgi:3-oxoadipate enol-lactonase